MKKSINIGVFDPKLIYTASPYPGDNIFAKGLEANGYEVVRFDYRATLNPDNVLLDLAKQVQPDLFWFGKCERISPETIGILKSWFPKTVFVKWAADVRNEPTEHDLGHLKYIDLFVATFAGDYLKKHKENMPDNSKVLSIFTFTDSDFYTEKEKNELYVSEVLWTGRRSVGDNQIRNDIINFLLKSDFKTKIFGIENTQWLQDDYVDYINNTKIGIGSNSYNRCKYSSDRLGNYMSCGTFYLTQYIEGIEECFERGTELDWFGSVSEMKEKIIYYLSHEEERRKIAKQGRVKILKYFDYKPLVENILYVLETGKSKNSWDEIY